MYVEEGFKNKSKQTWGITTAGTPSGNDVEPPPLPVEPKAKAGAKQPRTKTAFEVSLATANTAKKAFLDAREKSEKMSDGYGPYICKGERLV